MATTARRNPPGRSAARPASSGYRGEEGRRRMVEEEQRAAARREASSQMSNMPFRFFCPVGETRQFIVVDDAPDFFRFEHTLRNSRTGRWDIHCACINEDANCPVCKVAERPSYFAMYLTIIDLTPYTTNEGEDVPWSKKLLVVKPQQQKKFTRLYERHGSLRGMLIEVTRDGEKDASIGNDVVFVEVVPDEEFESYETQYTDKQGKVHDIIGYEPFDYDELFPLPTEQALRALVGGAAEPGSRESSDSPRRRSSGSSGDGWDEDAPPARRATTTTRRTTGRPAPREDDPGDAEPEGEAPPARARATMRGRPAPASRAEPEEPRRPTATRAVARRAPPPREDEYEDDPADEQEARPQRARPAAPSARPAATSLADRRRGLRRP